MNRIARMMTEEECSNWGFAHDDYEKWIADMIMINACHTETLRMSLARLAEAAIFCDEEVLTPSAVYTTYWRFDMLSRERIKL